MMEYHVQPHTYELARKHGKIDLMMNEYIYLYIPWTIIQDTGIWTQNCAVVLKTGIP